MVKITNGVNIFEVSKGAFDSIYEPQGFILFKDKRAKKVEEVVEEVVSDDDAFCVDLLEKPIGSWNKEELKRFCELKEIDTSAAKNVAEAKAIIKQFIEA